MYWRGADRAGHARLARRPALHAQRRLQRRCRPRHHRRDHHRARARPADAGRRRPDRRVRHDWLVSSGRRARHSTGRKGTGRARQRSLGAPSFVLHAGCRSQAAGRHIRADMAFGGVFYAIVDAKRSACRSTAAHLPSCVEAGCEITGPLKPRAPSRIRSIPPRGVFGTIFTGPPRDARRHLRTVTVFAGGAVDRSPCGTGMAAVMAVLDAMGLLEADERPFVHESDRRHDVQRTGRRADGGRRLPAIVPEIDGSAWITGEHIVPRRRCAIRSGRSAFQLVTPPDGCARSDDRSGGVHQAERVEKLARQTVEQLDKRFAVQRRRRRLRRPRQLVAPRHRRHPDLPHRRVRRDDELRLARFFEHEVEHAVLQLDLEALLVGKRQQRLPGALRAPRRFSRGIPARTASSWGPRLNLSRAVPRLRQRKEVTIMHEWTFSSRQNGWSALMLAAAIVRRCSSKSRAAMTRRRRLVRLAR